MGGWISLVNDLHTDCPMAATRRHSRTAKVRLSLSGVRGVFRTPSCLIFRKTLGGCWASFMVSASYNDNTGGGVRVGDRQPDSPGRFYFRLERVGGCCELRPETVGK